MYTALNREFSTLESLKCGTLHTVDFHSTIKHNWSRNFCFLWKLGYVIWCLLGQTGERMFCWRRHMRGHVMFERINMTLKTVEGGPCIGSPCFTSLIFADDTLLLVHLAFVVTSQTVTCQRTSYNVPVASFLFHGLGKIDKISCFFFPPWINLLLLICEWCLLSGLGCCCWFWFVDLKMNWTADNKD